MRATRKLVFGTVLLVVALLAAACGGSEADYPSEDFRWVVPYSPGGGFDTYSRGFAQTMTDFLPDGIDVAVENITPINEGLTTVYNSDSDYTLAIMPMPAAAAQEIQFPDVSQWETDKFTVLGSIEENSYVVYVAGDGPYASIDDLMAASGLTALTVERGSSSSLAAAVAIAALGLDAELTYGAEGSQEVATALVRGDVDFIVYGESDLVGFVESGDLKPVLYLGDGEPPAELTFLQGVPKAGDIGYPDAAGVVTEMRLIVAPPGISDDAKTYLEAKVDEVLNSDEFAAWAEEAGRPLVPRDAESARQAMENQIRAMQELIPSLVEQGIL